MLLESIQHLIRHGHELTGIYTAKAEPNYKCSEDDFRNLADAHAVPFSSSGILCESEESVLSQTGSEIAISINWPRRIGQTTLDLFRFGILNAHAGDIPRYRGNACLNWAILRNEPEVAVVVHQMLGDRIDEGPIYARSRFQLSTDTYIGELYDWLRTSIPRLFAETMDQLTHAETVSVLPPHPGPPLRCYPRSPSDAQINWNLPVEEIHALVRASSRPFGGAYSFLEDERVTIWRAVPLRTSAWGEFCAVPGQLIRGPGGQVAAATGTTPLILEEVAAEGSTAQMAMSRRTGRLSPR